MNPFEALLAINRAAIGGTQLIQIQEAPGFRSAHLTRKAHTRNAVRRLLQQQKAKKK